MRIKNLLISLCKGISADKNPLVTFSTKSVSLLLKNVCEVWPAQTLFDVSMYFDENQEESICCKKSHSYTNYNTIDC